MRYRNPFTSAQRREAVREYESFASNVRAIRKTFAPATRAERRALTRYAKHVEVIGRELLKIKPRVEVLNSRIEQTRYAMAEYFRVKHFGD